MTDWPLRQATPAAVWTSPFSRVFTTTPALPADTDLEQETALVCIMDEQLDEPDCQALSRIDVRKGRRQPILGRCGQEWAMTRLFFQTLGIKS